MFVTPVSVLCLQREDYMKRIGRLDLNAGPAEPAGQGAKGDDLLDLMDGL